MFILLNKEAHSFNYNYKTSSLHAINATMKKLCVFFCSKTDFLCCILVFVPSKVCMYYFYDEVISETSLSLPNERNIM